LATIPLTFATTQYEHFSDLAAGRVTVEGVDLTLLEMRTEEVFFRYLTYAEFDVSEISFAKYASMISQGDTSSIAIPVFPMRCFRHSSIYVRRDGAIKTPNDLAGKRVGVPEWAETSGIYIRGALQDHYDVDLRAIHWVQAGVNEPGRTEKVALHLPSGLAIEPAPSDNLSDLLVAGKIDAIMAARAPRCFLEGNGSIVRLFEDFIDVETRYFRETGIYPIMHAVVIRKGILDRYPWVAMNFQKALEDAKHRSYVRLTSGGPTPYMDPWAEERARSLQTLLGNDYYPYGVERNRKTLAAFLHYAFAQGVCHRLLEVEELFAPQTLRTFRV
jgi:4,5-dihydroxyphthalate decarboxylase